jgi:hypothetical protein
VIFTFVIVTFFTLLTEFVTLLTEFVTIFTVYTVNGEKFDFFFFRADTLYGFRALTLYGYYVSFVLSAVGTVCNHGRQPRGTSGSELLRATL